MFAGFNKFPFVSTQHSFSCLYWPLFINCVNASDVISHIGITTGLPIANPSNKDIPPPLVQHLEQYLFH